MNDAVDATSECLRVSWQMNDAVDATSECLFFCLLADE